jgi:alkylhydroperoxidase/carboxymuconolactone decarboxylase family protein YurZ
VPPDKPLWLKAFDAAERAVAPRLEEAVQSPAFAEALALALRAQATARRALQERTRALWHLANLPAASDVAALRRDVAALDRELRAITVALERALADREETDDAQAAPAPGRAPRARRAAGPRAPGRRAQRPAGP